MKLPGKNSRNNIVARGDYNLVTAPTATHSVEMALKRAETIADISILENLIEELPSDIRSLTVSIYRVQTTVGIQHIPESMHPKVTKWFGSVEAALEQTIVRIDNRVTLQSALFNELRAKRPIEAPCLTDKAKMNLVDRLEGCDFCNPEQFTPSEIIPGNPNGRIRGKYCITASNVAKYDANHALIIPDIHNPLHFTPERLRDNYEVALQWFAVQYEADHDAACPLLTLSVFERAGSSVAHGHHQMVMSRGGNYSKPEMLKKAADDYQWRTGRAYFDDLYTVHKALGLAFEYNGSRVIVELTPEKEKGVMILGNTPTNWAEFPGMADAVCFVLNNYKEMGVDSLNVAVFFPAWPLDNGWSRIPIYARMVDRGQLKTMPCDIGPLELYGGTPVISTDPFVVAKKLSSNLREEQLSPSAQLVLPK
ncbi:MAG: hypothetical protein V1702_05020 [Candidatus Woesearchaeota archaeon]